MQLSIAGVSRIRLRLHLTDRRRKSSRLENIRGELRQHRFRTYFSGDALDLHEECGGLLDQIKCFRREPVRKI